MRLISMTRAALCVLFVLAEIATHSASAADRVLMYHPTTGGDCNYSESCPRWASTAAEQTVVCTFDDPIPQEAVLKQIIVHRQLAVQGPLTGYANVWMRLNGNTDLGSYTITNVGACDYNLADYFFGNGFSAAGTPPGWNRGGMNTFTTTFVSTCCPRVNVDVLHDSLSFGAPTYEFHYALDTDLVVVSGTPQTGVISHPVEQKIVARAVRPNGTPFPAQQVRFEFVSQPASAAGAALGADDNAAAPTYTTNTDANGEVSATVVLGNKAGDYTVRAIFPNDPNGTAAATFVLTAKKPNSIAILKDTTDVADRGDAYVVSSTDDTKFYAVGLDAAGQRIGPIKVNWSTSASGPASTRGGGTIAPSTQASSTIFHPIQVGKLKISANPQISGIGTAAADLFITKLYVSIGSFDAANPVDQSDKFIPGMNLDGSNTTLDTMRNNGQLIGLHVLTGGARGKATFTLDSTNYPGIANNWPMNGDTSEDMTFADNTQSVVVDFNTSTGDTFTALMVHDYGASGTIKVSMQAGKKTYQLPPIKLPLDANNDGMPEAKWYVVSNEINPAGLLPASDADNDSGAAQNPGDGLSAWEEMRGIVVGQQFIGQSGGGASFTRLDPRQRDLFLVIDQDLLALGATPISYLTALPMRIHYLYPDDVAGIAHNNRLLTAIRPVVNPNRNGVPGARPQGQRAIRVIQQSQNPPTIVVEETVAGGGSIPHTVRTWQAGIFGATIPDSVNPDMIDHDQNGNAVTQFNAETPNTTSFVEVYTKTFENSAIHTSFAEGLLFGFYDENNNPVPQCTAAGQGGCDIWENASQLILPQQRWGGVAVDELHTVPRYQGEYYSKQYVTCADLNTPQPNGFSEQQMLQLRAAVTAHEIGHAMHMPHAIVCQELMFDANMIGFNRTMADILPVPTSYSSSERAQIRLR